MAGHKRPLQKRPQLIPNIKVRPSAKWRRLRRRPGAASNQRTVTGYDTLLNQASITHRKRMPALEERLSFEHGQPKQVVLLRAAHLRQITAYQFRRRVLAGPRRTRINCRRRRATVISALSMSMSDTFPFASAKKLVGLTSPSTHREFVEVYLRHY